MRKPKVIKTPIPTVQDAAEVYNVSPKRLKEVLAIVRENVEKNPIPTQLKKAEKRGGVPKPSRKSAGSR